METKVQQYLALLRKADLIDLMSFGEIHPYFAIVQLGDEPIRTSLEKLLSISNPFDYSVEYYAVMFQSDRLNISKKNFQFNTTVSLPEVCAVYALDGRAYRIGFNGLDLKAPIDEGLFAKFQKDISVRDAFNGITLLLNAAGIESKKTKGKTVLVKKDSKFAKAEDIEDSILKSLDEEPCCTGDSIWTYLLNYTRHQAYPKSTSGFVLDALEIAFSHAKGGNQDMDLTQSNLGNQLLSLPNALDSLIEGNTMIEKDKSFGKVLDAKNPKGFYSVAAMFLLMKSEIQKGDEHLIQTYQTLPQFLQRAKDGIKDDGIYEKATYLLGATIGGRGVIRLLSLNA